MVELSPQQKQDVALTQRDIGMAAGSLVRLLRVLESTPRSGGGLVVWLQGDGHAPC